MFLKAVLNRFPKPWPWFQWGLAAVWGLSLAVRFWGLGRFNKFVFDEVYFAKFAADYLTQTRFYDAHPPLGKLLIALGIWLGNHLFFVHTWPRNSLTGLDLSPWSYRWLNALVGSGLPLLMAWLAWLVSPRRSFALITALLVALDGLLLVESRYALINIYMLSFGLLGQIGLLNLARSQARPRLLWLLFTGLSFGATLSVKWNGLAFLSGIALIWAMTQWHRHIVKVAAPPVSLWGQLQTIRIWEMAIALIVLPLCVYVLVWIPHIHLTGANLWTIQEQMLGTHLRVKGNYSGIHPYCSAWYTWPFMIRPVVYLYESVMGGANRSAAFATLGVQEPSQSGTVIYDVHAMGNPLLWWAATGAVVLLGLYLAQTLLDYWRRPFAPTMTVALYSLVNFGAHWLPWTLVQRCTFVYHYMGASLFSFLALGWVIDRWFAQGNSKPHSRSLKWAGWIVLGTLALAFLFWLPIYLGLPLTPSTYLGRRWLITW